MTDGPTMDAVQALFDEIAKHEDHCWQQAGRCVYCHDCDQRLYQGYIPVTHTNTLRRQRNTTTPKATQEMRARWGKE